MGPASEVPRNRRVQSRRGQAGALVCTALFLGACEAEVAAPAAGAIDATYQLEMVARAPLPAILSAAQNYRLEVLAGTLRLSSDTAFQRTIEYRTTERGVSRTTLDSDSGRYTLNGRSLALLKANGSVDSGTLSDDQLTVITSTGVTWEFQK